jgi:hypothetical protein
MSGKLGKYRNPKCPESGHALKFHRSIPLTGECWKCTWCSFSCDDKTAKTLYEPAPEPQEQVLYVETAPQLAFLRRTPATIAVEAPKPVVAPEPIVATATVANATPSEPVATASLEVIEPEQVSAVVYDPVLANTFIGVADVPEPSPAPIVADVPEPTQSPVVDDEQEQEVKPSFAFYEKIPEQPARAQDAQSDSKLAIFQKMKAMPDFHPIPQELSAFSCVAHKFSLREMK